MIFSGKAMFEVKNMHNLYGEYNVGNGYVINHIPPIITSSEFGSVLFGEDPGTIIDDIQYEDKIEKLSR